MLPSCRPSAAIHGNSFQPPAEVKGSVSHHSLQGQHDRLSVCRKKRLPTHAMCNGKILSDPLVHTNDSVATPDLPWPFSPPRGRISVRYALCLQGISDSIPLRAPTGLRTIRGCLRSGKSRKDVLYRPRSRRTCMRTQGLMGHLPLLQRKWNPLQGPFNQWTWVICIAPHSLHGALQISKMPGSCLGELTI